MKTLLMIAVVLLLTRESLVSQTPEVSSWVRNTTSATGYNSIPSNVQQVSYTSTDVYVSCTCIPGYAIGPWQGNPNTAKNQNFVFKITRNPQKTSGTPTTVGLGHIGVWTNGVSIFNVEDAMTYNNQGVWYRNAYFFEGGGFDNCLGHPQQQGEYHHHVSPTCLYNDKDSMHHSPIIGFAFDGFPVYGAYAYSNTNGTGAIKRMTPSYRTRTISDRTTLPNGSTATFAGPAIGTTYPLGAFIQDFEYVASSGDLDNHNGRFCVTPEYPAGTYAYFVTIDAAQKPVFPYTFYGTFYGIVQTGNTGPNSGHNTIPGTAVKFTGTTPQVSIAAASGTSICEGDALTFTSTISNGGSAPSYQWFKNKQPVGKNEISYTATDLKDKDSIQCQLTNTDSGVSPSTVFSNSVVVKVNTPATVSVSVSSSPPGAICEGAAVAFTATPTNGGTVPQYRWKVNGVLTGTGAVVSMTSLKNKDMVEVELISNATCVKNSTASSGQFAMTVYALPAIPIITQSSSILSSSSAIGNQWYADNVLIQNATEQSYAPGQNGKYSVTVTDSNGCVSRSVQFSFTSSDVSELSAADGFTISPNPFAQTLQVQSDHQVDNAHIRLVDAQGRELFSIDRVSFAPSVPVVVAPMVPLSSDVYFLEITWPNHCSVFKLLRQ